MAEIVGLDQVVTPVPPDGGTPPPSSATRMLLPSLSGKLLTGLVIVALIVLLGLVGPLLAQDPRDSHHPALLPPGGDHWLGTTKLGYDVFAQLAHGTRGSLFVGIVAGAISLLLAVIFGVFAGYFGGWLDELLTLVTNIMLVIPGLPLVMVIAAYVQHTEGLGPLARSSLLVAFVLGITGWAGSAVVLRATAKSVRAREYVWAARVAGERPLRIIFVEILPNLVPLIAAQFIFGVIFAVLGEAGLSYLGLGPTGSITLGTMLNDAQTGQAVGTGAWWWFVPPGAVIAALGAGLSLINFAIDEVVNPKLRLAPEAARSQRLARKAGRSVVAPEAAA
ncbi:MAG: ABC transporter permease [Propionicimonas sp.]|uniref:ABC transporter permease n=1 Tax=Propionicimonas sp. TaxID=1955623 RepID=UPI002B1FBF0B|nr:ABC transporter permease [Propionicimonas sp.]MEA4943421.1 ABC transporter permease [Propionicimonas sp.]MEA5051861.1 ABC transporter permease [Propionicimonas sp.]MEA5117948.1 ABC transporter permease [Propionicimonas sp.]